MAFDFDIIYVKGNTIPYVDALSRLRFQSENGVEHENSEDRIIQYWWRQTYYLAKHSAEKPNKIQY